MYTYVVMQHSLIRMTFDSVSTLFAEMYTDVGMHQFFLQG